MDILLYKKRFMILSVAATLVYIFLVLRCFMFGEGNIILLDIVGTLTVIIGMLPKVPECWIKRGAVFTATVIAFLLISAFVEMDYLDNNITCRWALLMLLCTTNIGYTHYMVNQFVKMNRTS